MGASDERTRAISTVVAHFLHTEGVTGSNPVSPIFKCINSLKSIELFLGS